MTEIAEILNSNKFYKPDDLNEEGLWRVYSDGILYGRYPETGEDGYKMFYNVDS